MFVLAFKLFLTEKEIHSRLCSTYISFIFHDDFEFNYAIIADRSYISQTNHYPSQIDQIATVFRVRTLKIFCCCLHILRIYRELVHILTLLSIIYYCVNCFLKFQILVQQFILSKIFLNFGISFEFVRQHPPITLTPN